MKQLIQELEKHVKKKYRSINGVRPFDRYEFGCSIAVNEPVNWICLELFFEVTRTRKQVNEVLCWFDHFFKTHYGEIYMGMQKPRMTDFGLRVEFRLVDNSNDPLEVIAVSKLMYKIDR